MKKNLQYLLIGLALSFILFGMGLLTLTIFPLSEVVGQIAFSMLIGFSIFGGFLAAFRKSIREYLLNRKNWRNIKDNLVGWYIIILSIKLGQCQGFFNNIF